MPQPGKHASRKNPNDLPAGFVHVRGAREHNLKNIDVDIPRDALVVFTGVSGFGKSSLAFGTLYAEAQRRYLELVSSYTRRLFDQMPVPEVDEVDGLPPAVALQQQRGSPTTRSFVGSVTTLSNLIRMLYSRAGTYPPGQQLLYAESYLGLGYLSLDRSTPTLSPGELQRLRLATQVRSNLFGVVYVLDEPSAGLHPVDTEALLRALDQLKSSGNSLFVVEHDLDVIRHASWIVDVGPAAGQHGGQILYSGPPEGLARVADSQTRRYLFDEHVAERRTPRPPKGWLCLHGITRNDLKKLDVAFPLSLFTAVTGVSGSGKSSLVSQVLVELVAHLGHAVPGDEEEGEALARSAPVATGGRIAGGMEAVRRLVLVDQKPIGRTPHSNLATYTGLFDHVRKLFASTRDARARRYDAGRFSFNVAKGRCETCEGEGFVSVELLFLPSVYAPRPACHGARYNAKTLEIKYRDKNIADVLAMTMDAAAEFFVDEPPVCRSLDVLREVGLGYLRLGQPATELSGGEAQRIKLATELQRIQRGDTLYILDEPTTGLHSADMEKLRAQLDRLVESGNTVIVVEHHMQVVARADWVINIGPGAGDEDSRAVASGTPDNVSRSSVSRTAPYLARFLRLETT